jgi:branched-chain amino acid transport system substrate-binding protein
MNSPITANRAIVAGAVCVLACSAARSNDLQVRIGHVAPMSGSQAHLGKDLQNGAQMAIDELNARGVAIGGRKVRFQLIAEDDAADPKQGAAAARKLCDSKVGGVVGHLNSGTTIPASKIYSDCGIPMITPAASNPKLTHNGYRHIYRMVANDDAIGARLAAHAASNLKLKRVAVIDDRTAYGQGIAEVFRKTAAAQGIEIVAMQYTNDKASDFSPILTAIKAKQPDGVFFGGMSPQAGPMLRQMEQLGMSGVKYFGGDGICSEKLPELASNSRTVASVVCAESGVAQVKAPRGIEWRARYDARYPGEFQNYAAFSYDAVMVLANGMERAASIDPAVYSAELPKTRFAGITSAISFDPNGDLREPKIALYVYRDGRRTALD